MLFNSLHFLLFFPVVVLLHFALPQRLRWLLLLIASYYFYMSWRVEYIGLIIASTVIDYFAALWIQRSSDPFQKRLGLAASLATNLGILVFFKYFDFFARNLELLLASFGSAWTRPEFHVLLPVGISFYTFQTLSYTIDVYLGRTQATKDFGRFAVFVSFFPQLVAGPIERSFHLLPQFNLEKRFEYDRVVSGLRIMLWGLFKKVVIADRLATLVDPVYSDPSKFGGAPLLLATVFFAFQIYCDFSGYSDMAIGAARILGFDLMENFRRPYHALSIGEFWKRWHISLSTWFRDYVYIPLGGNRRGPWRLHSNLLITFLVSGLWHGASWNFVVWGALHASYLLIEMQIAKTRLSFSRWMPGGLAKLTQLTLCFVAVCFAWIFFRADSLSDAFYIIAHLFEGAQGWSNPGSLALEFRGMGLSREELTYGVFAIAMLSAYEFFDRNEPFLLKLGRQPLAIRWAFYYAIVYLCLFYAPSNVAKNFIYFQF